MTTGIVKSKLDVIEDTLPCKAMVTTLLVLLPGAYDTPDDFVRNGFVSALRERNIAADIVIADMHIAYYTAELMLERLHQDIVLPARQKGYAHIWLIGISLGGYGSLLYARQHATEVDGLFLMAPFLGNRSLLAEIGKLCLSEWQPGEVSAQDGDRRLWAWLKGYSEQDQTGLPLLYIGYGTEDRFAGSNRTLARVLPENQVMTTDGGHEWLPWQRLWIDFLDRKILPRCD
ncbi:alpha/beta hydrolase [Herminiimonas fonticola]|uniref:Enterochelin esterase-like enzyme n=1 Tax=Herminiimonas fonticola TaxID=303380 RepID=A0A4R6GGX2_9BURK|nr:alpha/beta hydrolase [Herminiimonas fonticola]RBA25057.1 Alpha/beta hydrolase family [Herminiimonas fonticola]TDN94172.1 enterochelin esterase-like enzyme [Herminiimonas fonticola]